MAFFFSRNILVSAILATAAILAPAASAQGKTLKSEDRDRYVSELRNYKHDFLTRDLELTRDQQREFFALYDEMDERLQQLSNETRELERKADSNTEASATEVHAAARAVFEQTVKEGNIELEYFDKFAKVLTPRQLLKLKSSEKKFTQYLLRQHRRRPMEASKKQPK